MWISRVHAGFEELGIPEYQWVDSAMYLLRGCLKADMAVREERAVYSGEPQWSWELFQQILARVQGPPSSR